MKRLAWWLYQPYKYLVFFPFLMVSTVVMGALAMVLAATFSPRAGSRIAGVAWARMLGYLTPIAVRVEGRENVDASQSYVVVSNHSSHYDVVVLYGWLGIDFKWVMKQELRKVPALGVACDKLGHIYIDRSDSTKAVASIRAARERITGGTSVIFFAEGTRGRHGGLGEFKKGAFRFAVDLELPILPITLEGTRRILPPRTRDLKPGRARMVIHPPISHAQYREMSLPELMAHTRSVIGSALSSGECRSA